MAYNFKNALVRTPCKSISNALSSISEKPDFEKVIPELIKETPDINNPEQINKSINYGNVVGLLVEAIKEQQETIDKLTRRINDIEKGE